MQFQARNLSTTIQKLNQPSFTNLPQTPRLMLFQARNLSRTAQKLSKPKPPQTSKLMQFQARKSGKPKSSEVLICYLQQCGEPPWTSYFVKYSSVVNDQWGKSHFNWKVGGSNYHVLRTGCYPYIKYHCTKRPVQDLALEDAFFRCIKVLNLGIPCLAYGVAALFLIRHTETVNTSHGPVQIFFLYPEDKGSSY